MASAQGAPSHPPFLLTPQQQNLLFRALASNQQPTNSSPGAADQRTLSLSPDSFNNSPVMNNKTGSSGASIGADESPLFDQEYDFGDQTNFDFTFDDETNQSQMIGDLPAATSSADSAKNGSNSNSSSPERENSTDKRSHDDDDDDAIQGSGKRRESEGKVSKKPGRKPLTNEPTTKRKAQNRAAQRAFRERKEQHLKDLETKVEELEQASKDSSSENSQLRSQIEKMTIELNEYKKRLSLMSSNAKLLSQSRGNSSAGFGSAAIQNINDVSFQFEFPKFGRRPTDSAGAKNDSNPKATYPSPSNSTAVGVNSPSEKSDKPSPAANNRAHSDSQPREASARPNNPSPYENMYGFNGSRASLDSGTFSLSGTVGASPSTSSNCNTNTASSCGTSPEPTTQSPGASKPLDTLTTIGEEQPTAVNDTGFGTWCNDTVGNIDFGNFDFLSQQNGGQFNPQLFSDYRESQDNILANANFDDSFFNDAFDIDFTTPFNTAPAPAPATTFATAQPPQSLPPPKKNLIDEIDARKEMIDDVPPISIGGKLLTCNNIWEKLQTCPKVQNGDLDLDGLCSDLQKKAKCGGSGAVVEESDFKSVMTKYLGPDARCPTEEEGK